MTELYISSISMHQYSLSAKPSGAIGVAGSLQAHFTLTDEEAEELSAIARKIFSARQQAFVSEVAEAKISSPLIGVVKTIDSSDDLPF